MIDNGNPLKECCPGCSTLGRMITAERTMNFNIGGHIRIVPYFVYKCGLCKLEFITDSDPFQKAKELGWVKG